MRAALVGYMRSGKDSVAGCLRHLSPAVKQISFATALKREAATALNATRRESADPYFTEAFFNDDNNRLRFRPFLQWYGTEYRRAIDPDYWVRVLEAEVLKNPTNDYVCTDARFSNELEMLHRMGFKILHLNMRAEEVAEYLRGKGLSLEQINAQMSHPSEREWQEYPKDISLHSEFGNLPKLTSEVLAYLTPPQHAITHETQVEIEWYFSQLYPEIYRQ